MKNKEIYFTEAEKEIIECLREEFGVTFLEASQQVIGQKREAAYIYSKRGNFDLAEHLLREICEWNDEVAKEFESRGRGIEKTEPKIILPGEF